MRYFNNVARKLCYLFKLYCLRDSFLVNVKRWFSDRGDETLRLDYPLNKSSVVFDVGGYLGDYADAVSEKFGCRVYLFEPVPVFYEQCVTRFKSNQSVKCLNYGLSSRSGWFEINLNNDESSFKRNEEGCTTEKAEIRSISEAVHELGVQTIDLIKINIEGGEFDLLPAMIESGIIRQVKYIQIQFHNFVDDAVNNRNLIRELLGKTHREMWNYEFVWESWERL